MTGSVVEQPAKPTVDEIVDWCRRVINGEPISAIAEETRRQWKTVNRYIKRNIERVRKMDEERRQGREPSGEGIEDSEDDEEPEEEGGEEVAPPPSEPPLPPQTRVTTVTPRRTYPRRPPAGSRSRSHPTYEEAEGLPDEDDEIAPVFKGPEVTLERRLEKLTNMLKLTPKINKGNVNYVLTVCKQDPVLLSDPRNLYELLIELDGVQPKLARRVTDIVFAKDEAGDGGYDPYHPRGYADGGAAPYYPPHSAGGYPSQDPRYDPYPPRQRNPYDPPPRDPRAPPGMVTQDQLREAVDRERRLTQMEQENQRLRGELRLDRQRNVDRTDIVKIKRPITDRATGRVIDYEEEEVPRDIYFQKMEQERSDRMLKMMEARPPAAHPQQNQEIIALKQTVDALKEELRKKDKDEAMHKIKEELSSKLGETNRNMADLMRDQEKKLARLESIQNAPSGGLGDDAQVIIAEIRHGTELTRELVHEASKTVNNALDIWGKASRPNKPRREHDRREYKEDMDDDEVRVIQQEVDDGDVEEG